MEEIDGNSVENTTHDYLSWKKEIERRFGEETKFMQELHSRKDKGSRDMNDIGNDNYLPEDMESSYVRTDDDDLGDTDSYIKPDEDSNPLRTDDEDAELYDRDPKELQIYARYMTDDDSCLETDQESYIRTDDEDGGNTDWEENRKRWINR